MDKKSIVISSRIRLARNIKDELFPSLLDEVSSKRIIDMVKDSILESNSYISKDFKFINLDKMKSYEKESLVEKHLISKELLESSSPCALINNDETVSIMINEEDHIRLQVINEGFSIDKCFDIANKLDDLIEEKITYEFDSKLGYITSCVTNLGCAMRASVMLHLPYLTKAKKITTLSKVLSKHGMTLRGLYGEGSGGFGNIYQVSNEVSLGISEKNIIDNLKIVVEKIIDSELVERNTFKNKGKEEFEDYIFRSLGILRYVKVITSIEALNLLSNVRCGVEMGIIDSIKLNKIQYASEIVQSGNIQRILSKKISSRERDIERAKMLNRIFN